MTIETLTQANNINSQLTAKKLMKTMLEEMNSEAIGTVTVSGNGNIDAIVKAIPSIETSVKTTVETSVSSYITTLTAQITELETQLANL